MKLYKCLNRLFFFCKTKKTQGFDKTQGNLTKTQGIFPKNGVILTKIRQFEAKFCKLLPKLRENLEKTQGLSQAFFCAFGAKLSRKILPKLSDFTNNH